MMFPTPMKQLVAVVPDSEADNVTRALLDRGVMHFMKIHELVDGAPPGVVPLEPGTSQGEVAELRRRIETMLAMGDEALSAERYLDVSKLSSVRLDHTRVALDRLASSVEGLRTKQNEAQQEILKLQDIRRQIDLFGDVRAGMRANSQFSYLTMRTGSVLAPVAGALGAEIRFFPSVLVELNRSGEEVNYFLVTMKRDEKEVARMLEKHRWRNVDLSLDAEGLGDNVLLDLDGKIAGLRSEQQALDRQIRETVKGKAEELRRMWANIRMNELCGRIQSNFSRTSKTVLFTGWVPASQRDALEYSVRTSSGNRCYLEWHDPPSPSEGEEASGKVPVDLVNPKVLSPFQMLVKNYSIPEYGTIDPTPLVAVAYLIMFGLMFGDAGHGLVLVISGLIGRHFYRKQNKVRELLSLLVWCGSASIVSGVLFGAYFGIELLRPLWFSFHGIVAGRVEPGMVSNIYDVLVISIYFGISVIGLGLILNWINLVNKAKWFDMIFSKGGLLGGLMYGGGVWAAMYFVRHDYRQLPGATSLILLFGIPVIIIAFKSPLEHWMHRNEPGAKKLHALSFVDFFMDWVVEVLEIFTGYLSNTLSFMRVAGLGIAHEALMLAFTQIAMMASGGERLNIIGFIIFLAGSVLVIVLEGLSAGIQSLRLNYYEFFSKYFSGNGKAYEPVSLRSKD